MATLIVLCGPPGAGKSTHAAKLGVTVLSADGIRLGTNSGSVFRMLYARALATLKAGQSVVLDVCALQECDRLNYLKLGRKANARCELHVLGTPVEVCRARNAARPIAEQLVTDWKQVKVQVDRMRKDIPREGWDRVTPV